MATSIKISQLPQLTEPTTGSLAVMVDSGITHFITTNDLFNNGLDISSNTIHATNNGNGTNFKVGDDAWIGDVNIGNTIQIKGQQDGTKGYIKFGSGSSTPKLGYNGSNNILDLDGSLKVNGSFNIVSSSLFPQNTGSSLVSYDQISGQLYHTTYASALPALFAAGGFYSTQTQSGSANVSSSFTFNESLGINSVNIQSGSHIVCDKAATYNLQFSIQIVQGPSAANVAVWLKKNGSNVANTATYVSVPSNTKQVMALNIWDSTTTPGDYYELAYQSDSANTTYQAIAATGNIPLSPSIILTVNQIR